MRMYPFGLTELREGAGRIYIYNIIPKRLEIEKEILREVARGDKPYLRKSIDRKAQIRKAFVQFSGLICALRSLDFLR